MPKSSTTASDALAVAGAVDNTAIATSQLVTTLGQPLAPVTSSQEFPALQASKYEGLGNGQTIDLCFNAGSTDLLSDQALVQFGLESHQAFFNGEMEVVGVIKNAVQWVVLTRPEQHLRNKELKRVARMPKGYLVQSGTGIVSCARVLLAAVAAADTESGADFVRTETGEIQVFTLNLASLGVSVIGSARGDFGVAKNGGMLTLTGLNSTIASTYKVNPKCWWTHLVAVTLGCVGARRGSKTNDKTSIAATYVFGGPVEPLAPEQQAEMAEFINTSVMQSLFADPFRLSRANAAYDGPDPFADTPAIVDIAPDSEAF